MQNGIFRYFFNEMQFPIFKCLQLFHSYRWSRIPYSLVIGLQNIILNLQTLEDNRKLESDLLDFNYKVQIPLD